MDFKEFGILAAGDFVEYVGPETNKGGLGIGRKYEVIDVNFEEECFEIALEYVIGNNPFAKEWDMSSYKRVKPEANLQKDDYGALIDCALETKDFNWVKELHALAFSEN